MKKDAWVNKFPELSGLSGEKRNQFLKHFSTAPDWILDYCSVEIIPSDTFFIREGEPVHTIYFVVDGMFKAIDYRVMGVEYVYAKFSKIYPMGGMEVLMDFKTYRTTLKTLNECTAIRIPRAAFEKWLQADIQGLRYESKMMGEYLLTQGRLAREYLFLPGPERLAKIFIQKYESDAIDGILRTDSMLQDLSNETGFTIRTVSRALKSLSDKGLLSKDEKNIVVDREQYEKLKELVEVIVSPDDLSEED